MSTPNVSVFMLERLKRGASAACTAIRATAPTAGDGTNGLNLAFHEVGDELEFVQVPPLPPHIRLEHARGFARAILHGDPAGGDIVRQSLREKLKDLVTR